MGDVIERAIVKWSVGLKIKKREEDEGDENGVRY